MLAVAALVPLFLMFGRVRAVEADIGHREALSLAQRKETERNQQAILRLLDELAPLADGDLTVQATVTEDITGTIADSINYAIGVLRDLVSTINQSAIQLDGATRQTQALSAHLAKASSAQSKQIAGATESASNMASSTEAISGNSERASDVARHSVDVAHKGGDAVRRTIDGMNSIRETIQETSKRIKRLGESSQEIGNIVELINDIAEQTNILALNASIQASMAGDAGRGFAVVADEVQRLAERAAAATRQIETLVRAIQADTNEAVVSMERSTTDVVGGALLAENAGAALEEIEQVSSQIASLVNNIFCELAPAGDRGAEDRAEHAGAQGNLDADRRVHDGDLAEHFEARAVVGRDAPVRIRIPPARRARAAPGGRGRRRDRGCSGCDHRHRARAAIDRRHHAHANRFAGLVTRTCRPRCLKSPHRRSISSAAS